MPSLSVLIPTLNCRSLIHEHLEAARPWIDLADEIIVVDSHSTDGTLEYIRDALAALPLQIVNHPRGLYQSWNHGIALARTDWLYISTVGDSITRTLLVHLQQLALAGRCDVAISLPERIDTDGKPLPPPHWAVTEITTTLARNRPCILTGSAALCYATRFHRHSALLGSSASNLYRTAHLQARPFPIDYGTAGDAAWALLHGYETRFGFTSAKGSTFRLHEKAYRSEDYEVHGLAEKLLRLGLATVAQHDSDRELSIAEAHHLEEKSARLYAELKNFRRTHRPWFFFPSCWRLRSESDKIKLKLREVRERQLAMIQNRLCEQIELST
jgi:glycosyltransferase involved in cell wall biosynthesis